MNNFLKVSWHAACRRLRAKLLTPAARRILAPAPKTGIIINRLGVEVIKPRAQVVTVFGGKLAVGVV